MNKNIPNKHQLADKMRNNMHISDEFLPMLTIYHMRHTSGAEFKRNLIDGQIDLINNQVSGGATSFNVIYHNCMPVAAKKAIEIRLSFRAAKPEYNIEPYVLVQIVIGAEDDMPIITANPNRKG